MTETRPVSIKSSREMFRPPEPAASSVPELHDRRNISVRWFDRANGREQVFTGQIRVLTVPELSRAVAGFVRLTGGAPFDTLPTELRNRLWVHAKLFVMLDGQPGSTALLDAFDTDRFLLVAVFQEVDKLEAECFRDVLGEGEGMSGSSRVVVATSRVTTPAAPSANP